MREMHYLDKLVGEFDIINIIMKPTVIYVSGAPGSGKSTLANLLAERLYIHRISSDLVKGGLAYTDPNQDRNVTTGSVFVPMLIEAARLGVSYVVDHVLQKEIAKETIIDKLTPLANVIYIHVEASDPITRYIERTNASTVPDVVRRRDILMERAVHHKDNLENTRHVIDLGVPTLIVNTDDGYEPNLEQIFLFIEENRRGSLKS